MDFKFAILFLGITAAFLTTTTTSSTNESTTMTDTIATSTTNEPTITTDTNTTSTTIEPTTTVDVCTYCENGATCEKNGNEYNCTCVSGWMGKNCSTDVDDCSPNPCQNGGGCTDAGNNNYTCSCVSGWEGKNCTTDIDDCSSNPCENGGTCTDAGINNYTCSCVTGWQGKNCTTDVDDCSPNPCQYGGNCTDAGTNKYTCSCPGGWKGKNCTSVDHCYGGGKCENEGTCVSGDTNYTCTCTTGWTGWRCHQSVDDCDPNPCKNNGNCTDGHNSFNCSCTAAWQGNTCEEDFDECSIKPCINGTCVNVEPAGAGKYTCKCNPDYEGINCDTVIDNCKNNTCKNNGVCVDGINDYQCTCTRQWKGKNCTEDVNECMKDTPCKNGGYCQNTAGSYKCFCKNGWKGANCTQDVDECQEPSLCDERLGWNCTNTNGSYICQCKNTHVKQADKCLKILMLEDKSTEPLTGEKKLHGPFHVTPGIPYFDKLYYNIYVSTNGYIVLDRAYSPAHPPNNESDWPRDQTVIAPHWSDIDLGSSGRLLFSEYYRYHDDGAVLDAMTGIVTTTGFTAQYAVMVSWLNVIPYPASQYEGHQNATFQLIIATDGSKSHAVFTYVKYWSPIPDRRIVAGFSEPESPNTFHSLVLESAGTQSRKSYPLFNQSSLQSSNYECLAKHSENQDILNAVNTDDCPCSEVQAKLDSRFKSIDSTDCFERRFWQDSSKTKCCYDKDGVLLTDTRKAGWRVRQNSSTNTDLETEYRSCCSNKSSVCSTFFSSHPSDSCIKYQPLQSVMIWGNPHTDLPSEDFYIFNGLGEYHLIVNGNSSDSASIAVQGRTTQISGVNVTRFQAFAFKVWSYRVEIHLKAPTGVSVYLNGSLLTDGNSSPDWKFLQINNQYQLIFKTGIVIQVTAGDQLLLSLSVPKTLDHVLHGQGLIEVYTETNVTKLTLKEETWRIKQESSSLFNYSLTPDSNFTSLQDSNFTPKHFTNFSTFLQVLFGANNTVITSATDACSENIVCLVNYKISSSASLSTALKDEEMKQKETVNKLKNSLPPEFIDVQSKWSLNLDSSLEYTLQVSSKVSNSSDLQINVIAQNIQYSFNESTRQFKLNGTRSLRNISSGSLSILNFVVTDTTNNLTGQYAPTIIFCGCEEAGQCDNTLANKLAEKSKGKFYQAECNCDGTATGRFCEQLVDVCKVKCFHGSECNSSLKQPCLSCPTGLKGDGIKCYDEDECLLGTAGCDQECENTVGGFICRCKPGYNLRNKTKCVDINECNEDSCECMTNDTTHKYCVNTPGNCQCRCRPGYKGDECQDKVEHVYGGRLVFAPVDGTSQVWSKDLTDKNSTSFKELAKLIIDAMTSVFEKLSLVTVTVTKFEQISLTRRKREVKPEQYDIAASYEVGFNKSVSDQELTEAFNSGFDKSCKPDGELCQFGKNDNTLVAVSMTQSDIRETYNLCDSDDNNDCHDGSTKCHTLNGTFSCKCRDGFKTWPLNRNICEDIDECVLYEVPHLCGSEGTRCTNTPGSYECVCKPGYKWTDPSTNCTLSDVCGKKNPCKNGGTCVNVEDNTSGFACKCTYGWTGPECNTKDTEANKQQTIIIAVSASLGAFAFILLIILLCCWCRRGNVKDDNSSGEFQVANQHVIEYHADEYHSSKIPRPTLRLLSETDQIEMVESGSKFSLFQFDEEYRFKERQESMRKVTKFDHDTLSDHYDNPAYSNDESERHSRMPY